MSFIRKIIASVFLLACFQVVVMQVLPHHHHHHMICVLNDVDEPQDDHHDASHHEEGEADDDCCITKLQAVVAKLQNTNSSYNLLSFLPFSSCVVPQPFFRNIYCKYFDANNIDCCNRSISPFVGRAPPQDS